MMTVLAGCVFEDVDHNLKLMPITILLMRPMFFFVNSCMHLLVATFFARLLSSSCVPSVLYVCDRTPQTQDIFLALR